MASLEELIAEKLGGSSEGKNIDKAIELLSDKEQVNGYSLITEEDRTKFFKLGVLSKMFFPKSKILKGFIEDYCTLSKSVDGTGLKMIENLFKTDINMEGLEKLKQI